MAYIPKGCDQQGRHPQAAESCTDVGQEDDIATGITRSFVAVMLLVAFCFGTALLLAWLI